MATSWKMRGDFSLRSASLGAAFAALVLFAITFCGGIERGFDQTMPVGNVSRVVNALASYLTELAYGESGYAFTYFIANELNSRGLSREPSTVARFGRKVPDNLTDALFIDGILDGMWKEIPSYPPKQDLQGFGADDVGLVTFTKLAFFLFG